MKHLGIFSWFGYVLPFAERIELIKAAGFTATSVWWEDEDAPFPIKKEDMPALVRAKGLYLENIHAPFADSNALWSDNDCLRNSVIETYLQWLTDCRDFGIPRMVMHITEGDNPPAPNEHGLNSMLELVKAAEELGVVIAIENTYRTDNVPYLLNRIQSKHLGFCFDSSHHHLRSPQDFRLLEEYGRRLAATHLSDNDGLKDRHWLPGHGIIHWTELVRSFPKGYAGCLTLEAYPTDEERQGEPGKFLETAYQRIAHVQRLITEA